MVTICWPITILLDDHGNVMDTFAHSPTTSPISQTALCSCRRRMLVSLRMSVLCQYLLDLRKQLLWKL